MGGKKQVPTQQKYVSSNLVPSLVTDCDTAGMILKNCLFLHCFFCFSKEAGQAQEANDGLCSPLLEAQ